MNFNNFYSNIVIDSNIIDYNLKLSECINSYNSTVTTMSFTIKNTSLFFFNNPTSIVVYNNTFSNNFQVSGIFKIIKNTIYDSSYNSNFIGYPTVFANNNFSTNLAFSNSAGINFYFEGNINCKNILLIQNTFSFNGGCFNSSPSLNIQCNNRIETGITTGNKIISVFNSIKMDTSMISLEQNLFNNNYALQLANIYVNFDTQINTQVTLQNNIHLNNGVIFLEYYKIISPISIFQTIFPNKFFSNGSPINSNIAHTKTYSSCLLIINVKKLNILSDSFEGNFNFLAKLNDNKLTSQIIYFKYTQKDSVINNINYRLL